MKGSGSKKPTFPIPKVRIRHNRDKKFPVIRLIALLAILIVIFSLIERKESSFAVSVPESVFNSVNPDGNSSHSNDILSHQAAPAEVKSRDHSLASGNFVWNADSSSFYLECGIKTLNKCWSILNSEFDELGSSTATLIDELSLSQFRAGIENLVMLFKFSDKKKEHPFLAGITLYSEGHKEELTPLIKENYPNSFENIFCAGSDECLNHFKIYSPFSLSIAGKSPILAEKIRFFIWPVPELKIWGVYDVAVNPVMKGRVVAISAAETNMMMVKMYHGNGIYSYYLNMSKLRENILLGDIITSNQIIGYSSLPNDDGEPSLKLRLEKSGRLFNPLEVLSDKLKADKS